MPNSQFEQWRALYALEEDELEDELAEQRAELDAARTQQ
jgi:hypothetical protein